MESEKKMTQRASGNHRTFPWYGHIILAIFFYYVCRYGISFLFGSQSQAEAMGKAGETLAPIIAIVFLLLGANGLYKGVESKPAEESDEQDGGIPIVHVVPDNDEQDEK